MSSEEQAKQSSQPEAAAPGTEGEGEKKLSKKELRILERQRKEAEIAAQKQAQFKETFGKAERIQSQKHTGRKWTRIDELDESRVGEEVLIRGRVHTSRTAGKLAFVLLRQAVSSVQAVVFQSKECPKEMIKFVEGVPHESVVDITGTVARPEQEIESATLKTLEIHMKTFHVISQALPTLPFSLEDASRPDYLYEQGEQEEGEDQKKYVKVGQDVRLDNRWIDLRTPANQAIFRISSGVCTLFREFLLKNGFVEMQTPKLLGGASEGGANVFTLDYFGQSACLAQSPQLYKQMCTACADFERVFEIGPVFRAENSNTHRHLTEFHGLDMEMTINEHYSECLDVFSDLFIYIFKGLQTRFKKELEAVRAQHPFEDFKFQEPALRITFEHGIDLLREAGEDVGYEDDLSTTQEKKLGKIIREKYDTDFFMMDKFPLAIRAFYSMPDPEDSRWSNSYDFFMRGEEILSGAQRIHDPVLLEERARAKGIPVESIQSYVDSFRHGALPHAGGGVGLERVVMLFLGLPNIRKSALFPRDPKRLSP
eukprot:gb/GECG01003128.1/.p1 GENE.gb/GECG01003128.1/~~gb/GECG01003128.1/.p1  ORF type:complete len:540 (+),score=77.57 gb/GECG01003128.1/:1-1620(+)